MMTGNFKHSNLEKNRSACIQHYICKFPCLSEHGLHMVKMLLSKGKKTEVITIVGYKAALQDHFFKNSRKKVKSNSSHEKKTCDSAAWILYVKLSLPIKLNQGLQMSMEK